MQFILIFMYVRKTCPIATVVLQDWSPFPQELRIFQPQYRGNTIKILPIPVVYRGKTANTATMSLFSLQSCGGQGKHTFR